MEKKFVLPICILICEKFLHVNTIYFPRFYRMNYFGNLNIQCDKLTVNKDILISVKMTQLTAHFKFHSMPESDIKTCVFFVECLFWKVYTSHRLGISEGCKKKYFM